MQVDATTTKEKEKAQGKIWDEEKEPLQEGEELEYDGSAYQMLHRSQVEWPCLSIDFLLRERCSPGGASNPEQWFPSQVYGNLDLAAGNTIMDK